MKSFHFTNMNTANDPSNIDLVKFVQNLLSDARFAEADIYFVNHNRRDEDDSVFTRVHIDFMAYKHSERKSVSWRWHCYRSKSFCCFNNSFERMSE